MSKTDTLIIALQKKKLVSTVDLKPVDVEKIKTDNNFDSDEQLHQAVQQNMYGGFMQGLSKEIRVRFNKDSEDMHYYLCGYALSEYSMAMLIKELLEMDEEGKAMLLNEVNTGLRIGT